jgi:hypothetical protein
MSSEVTAGGAGGARGARGARGALGGIAGVGCRDDLGEATVSR